MRINNNTHSFTLVETLLAVSILTFLILSAFYALDIGRRSWFANDASIELRDDIIKALAAMEKELRNTRPSQIDLGAGSSSASLTFTTPQDNDGNGTILNSFGDVEWSANITYARNQDNQLIRTTSGATSILANNVTSILFSRPISPLDLLQVDIAVQRDSASGQPLQDMGQIIIQMRN